MSIDNVLDNPPRDQYTASASQTAFSYSFAIFADADLVVYDNDTLMVLTTDYTVSGAGDDNGGTVTFVSGRTAGHVITIYRDIAIERTSDMQQNGPWNSTTTNDEFDKAYTIMQELGAKIKRAIRFPFTATISDTQTELSPLSSWYGKFLRVSSAGVLEAAEIVSSVVALTQSVIGELLNPRTQAEIDAGVTPTNYQYAELDIRRYGGVGDNATNNTTAFISAAAVAAALGGGNIRLHPGIYRVGVVGDLAYGTKFVGAGPAATTIKRITASVPFTVKAFYVEFRDLSFDADVATSTTYGTAAAMIDYPTGFTSAHGRLINVDSANIDTVIRFAGDAGYAHQVHGGYWIAYTLTAGSEGLIYRTGVGSDDTGAMFRKIVGLTAIGEIDQTGSIDSQIQAVDTRRVRMDADTAQLNVIGGRWGSLDIACTIDGENTRVIGVSVSGSVTLASTMSGACVFKGNIQSSGTFTNNAPAQVCEVDHHPLSAGYTNIHKHSITHSNNAEEVQTRRVGSNVGNADATLTLDQSETIVMFGSAITADRSVTLPGTGRNGFTIRVVRMAAATGAFNVNVGTGPLKALAAASTWCEVTWSGPASAWVLTAYGTL